MRSRAPPDRPPPHHHHSPAEVFVLLTFLPHNSGIVAAGGRSGVYTAADQGRPSLMRAHWRALCHWRVLDRGADRRIDRQTEG